MARKGGAAINFVSILLRKKEGNYFLRVLETIAKLHVCEVYDKHMIKFVEQPPSQNFHEPFAVAEPNEKLCLRRFVIENFPSSYQQKYSIHCYCLSANS